MDFRSARFVHASVPATLIGAALAAALAGCSVPTAEGSGNPSDTPAAVRAPENGVLTLSSDDPAELALYASQALFDHSPVVVLADVGDAADRMTAAATGQALAAPVLLGGGAIGDRPVTAELERLGAEAVVVVGDEAAVGHAEKLAGGRDVVRFDPNAVSEAARDAVESVNASGKAEGDKSRAVVPDASMINGNYLQELREQIPDVAEPDLMSEVMLLVDPAEGQEAAIGTARAAGAVPYVVPGGDPGARADAISQIATADPLGVVGIGPGFDDEKRLAWQVDAARQQPAYSHGTQRLVGQTYVEIPLAPGADPAATAADAVAAAGSRGAAPVVSVTASMQASEPGDDGDHAAQIPVEDLSAAVKTLREAGVIVLLDIVPGNRPLADQLTVLEPLLAKPGVGVALHPEFRLAGNGAGVEGQVRVAELQGAVDRVASIVTEHRLPQTMVVVHQSTASSVTDRATLRARPQVVTVFAAAGPEGGGTTAYGVWQDVAAGLPKGTFAGWAGSTTGAVPPSDPAEPILVSVH